MANTYRIEGIFNPDGYKDIIFLAYLFRVVPDSSVLMINNISISSICTPISSLNRWFTPVPIIDGVPKITLDMRNIYNDLSSACFANYWFMKISGLVGFTGQNWYAAFYKCTASSGVPIINQAFPKTNVPINVTIDDSLLISPEPYIVDSYIFGLSATSYCDSNGILEKKLQTPIYLTV